MCNISGCKEAIWEVYPRVIFHHLLSFDLLHGFCSSASAMRDIFEVAWPTGKGKPMLYYQMFTPLLWVSCTSDRKDRVCIRGNIDLSIAENLDEWVIYMVSTILFSERQ